MNKGVEDKGGTQPAGSEAVAPKTLRLAELTAAADRARSGSTTTPEKSGATPEDPKGAVTGPETPSGESGADPNKAVSTPAGEGKPAEKTASGDAEPKPATEPGQLDPLAGPDNPFWKTQLGRYIREKEATNTAEITALKATIKLLESRASKGGAKPTEEEELERELGLTEDGGERGTEGNPEKGAGQAAEEEAQAKFTKSYLANNGREEFRSDPDFAEIQALMFNREDKENTFNKPWSKDPDACYRINFNNAKMSILAKRIQSAQDATTRKPGEGNLKGEEPTVPLGVGGDVKPTDGKPQRKAIDLDPHARSFLEHVRSKGRDPDSLMARAFAVDPGADRGARR